MLIEKDGGMIDGNAPGPGNDALLALIDRLLIAK